MNEKLPQLLPLVIAVVFLVILLAFKVKLGLSLFISSGVLLVFSGNGPVELVEIVRRTVTDGQFLEIIGIILLINLLEELLRKTNYFDRAFQVLQGTVKNRVKITALFPALFGLIPAFGGAKFSASLVDLAAQDLAIDRTEKSLLNYWFRHVWEFCSPLFPGVILAIYLSGVETGKYILLMLPSTILFIVLGTVFFLRPVNVRNQAAAGAAPVGGQGQEEQRRGFWCVFLRLFRIVWPILAIVFVVVVFKASILWPLLLTVVVLFAQAPKGEGFVRELFRKAWSLSTLGMVFWVYLFKTTFEWTGITQEIPVLMAAARIPSSVLLIVFPFTMGLLTAMPSAFVGITYPVLLPIFNHGGLLHLGAVMLAYVAGHIGTMLSPLHLCFVLTVEHFQTEILPFWTRLLSPQVILFILTYALAWVFGLPG